jgi:hypothetical protein
LYSGKMAKRKNGIVEANWICDVIDENENYSRDAEFIAQSRTIAPQAVRELIEARKLLKEVMHSGKNCRANSGAIYVDDSTIQKIEQYLGE